MKLTVWATTYTPTYTVYDWSEAEPGDVTTIELTDEEFEGLKEAEHWYRYWQDRLERVYEEG